MSKLSGTFYICKRPVIALRGGKVFQIGRYKGRKLEAVIAGMAARLGLGTAEVDQCLGCALLQATQDGERIEDFEAAVLAVHRRRVGLGIPTGWSCLDLREAGLRVPDDDPRGSGRHFH